LTAIRAEGFGTKPIDDGAAMLGLDTPTRAEDAAVVPITIHALSGQEGDAAIKKMTLIVDENPSPVVAEFIPGKAMQNATVSTRIRVNDYTNVRVVAETAGGKLVMISRYVKAAGGCSAPAGKDQKAALARLGKMKMFAPEKVVLGQPATFQILISHPNNSGLQFDQMTRNYIPAHYIKFVEISYDETPVLTINSQISISEDPSFHFTFVPDHAGTLKVKAVDNKEATFTSEFPVSPQTGS
jgi:sulfur-oxidizing protein SoxY